MCSDNLMKIYFFTEENFIKAWAAPGQWKTSLMSVYIDCSICGSTLNLPYSFINFWLDTSTYVLTAGTGYVGHPAGHCGEQGCGFDYHS